MRWFGVVSALTLLAATNASAEPTGQQVERARAAAHNQQAVADQGDAGKPSTLAPAPQLQPAAPPHAPQPHEERVETYLKRALPWWVRILFRSEVTNFLIMVFTAALFWIAYLQNRLETRLAADTGENLRIARKSAEAALLSARVSHAALLGGPRPMLVVEWTEYDPAVPPPLQPTDSHPVTIKFKITNCGERNAVFESFYAEVLAHVRDTDGDWPVPSAERLTAVGNFQATDLVIRDTVVMPGAAYPAPYRGFVSMKPDELEAMWGVAQRRLILLTLITYRDPLGIRRERGATLYYSPLAQPPNQWERVEGSDHDFDRIIDMGGLDFSREGDGSQERA